MNDSVLKGVLKFSVATWINLIIGFMSMFITTRLLEPEVYGLISIFNSSATVLLYIMCIGMDGALIRFYNEPPANDTKYQLIYKSIVISIIIGGVLGVIGVTFGNYISNFVFGFVSRYVIGVLIINVIAQVVLRYLNVSFRMSFQARKYTIQNVMISCLSRILVILTALFTTDFLYICSVVTIGILTVTIIYCFIQKKEITPIDVDGSANWSICMSGYSEYLKFALFSAPTYIVTYLNVYFSQQIIRTYLGGHDLGIYSSAAIFVTILSALQGGFSTYWSAYVYKNYNNERDKISRMHNYSFVFIFFIITMLIFFKDFIYIFIGKDFHESKSFFSLILLAPSLAFMQQTTTYGIAIVKKNHISLLVHVIAALVNIGVSITLIQYVGLIGAAIANAIAALVLYFGLTIFGQYYYKTITSLIKSILNTVLLVLLVVTPCLFMASYISMLLVLLLLLIFVFINRAEIIQIVGYLNSFCKK